MSMKIMDADARGTTFCADFFERLESSFIGNNPKKVIRLLCSCLEPPILKTEMRKRLDYDENLEKSLKLFGKMLTQEGSAKTSESSSKTPRRAQKKGHSPSSPSTPGAQKKPICPYPPHKDKGFRHYLKDCKDCPSDVKDKLFEELRCKKDFIKRTAVQSDQASVQSDQASVPSVIFLPQDLGRRR